MPVALGEAALIEVVQRGNKTMLSSPLAREIAAILAIKLILIGLLWFLFFRPVGEGEAMTGAGVGNVLLRANVVSDSKQP